ncbi:MAG: extracellular solute-binding protein, partial [Lachnospiraceae bacterium]|nr:extracellular solute-binding protein [Lachnospiraceae bacterium]
MNLKRRFLAIALVLIVFALVLLAGILNLKVPTKEDPASGLIGIKKDTIYIWYTDDTITDYLNSAAVSFGEKTDVRVIPVLKNSTEYLEQINASSLDDYENTPDLYIMSNDSLGKAYLAGLADKVRNTENLTTENYPQTALDACTLNGNLVAYPYYFETSAYLYNKTYLEDYVKSKISQERAEAAQALEGENQTESTESTEASTDDSQSSENTEEAAEAEEEQFDPEEVEARLNEVLPETMDELLAFADSYDAPPNVEYILKWDVSDIFYNYYFVGNYMNVGGPAGDDVNDINIYNSSAIKCLESYQTLNQFFYIDADTVTYEDVIQEFIDGKVVFSVATNDIIATLNAAKV